MTDPETRGKSEKIRKSKVPRQKMTCQDFAERIRNFDEVACGLKEEQVLVEAERCLFCKKPKCIEGCPVEIDIPGFLRLITQRDFIGAARKVKEKNILPAICGRVCQQEDQCEKACVLARKGEPVGIGMLERFVADFEAAEGAVEVPRLPEPTGIKIAVVGSGPAGLTVAADLTQLGHQVTVFEALHKPGGVLVYGIPEFRLPKAVLNREVDYLSSLGAEIRTSEVIGKIETVDELFTRGFNAVFLGTGAGLPYFMNIPGENLNGVYSANEFLTRSNLMKAYLFPRYDTPLKIGKRAAVVGAGNTAMDAARTALRGGAQQSMIVYRRSRTEVPARAEEVHHAEEEGIQFHFLTSPVRFLADDRGWVRAMECIRMELGEPDQSGRRRPVPVKGSEFIMEVDTVVMAIGQGPNPIIQETTPGLDTSKWGNILVDASTQATSRPGVYAGGDVVTGGATVILAMGAGRLAARSIHKYLEETRGGRR